MRLGVSLAQSGRLADPAAIRAAASAAEQVGYSSLWVVDRLVGARTAGGHAPGRDRADVPTTLDPLTVLAYAAACTTRVRLGTRALVAPWYRPALLARALMSLDVVSDGRLTVGLGLDATRDEHASAGVRPEELDSRLDDALDALDATFASSCRPGSPGGDRATAPSAPSASRRPPVLLAAETRAGLDRVARRADGWNPGGLPIDALATLWGTVRDLAAAYGRDPDGLQLVVRATLDPRDVPIDGERAPYSGTVDQIADDLAATRRAGAHEAILVVDRDGCLDEALDVYARVAEASDVTAAA